MAVISINKKSGTISLERYNINTDLNETYLKALESCNLITTKTIKNIKEYSYEGFKEGVSNVIEAIKNAFRKVIEFFEKLFKNVIRMNNKSQLKHLVKKAQFLTTRLNTDDDNVRMAINDCVESNKLTERYNEIVNQVKSVKKELENRKDTMKSDSLNGDFSNSIDKKLKDMDSFFENLGISDKYNVSDSVKKIVAAVSLNNGDMLYKVLDNFVSLIKEDIKLSKENLKKIEKDTPGDNAAIEAAKKRLQNRKDEMKVTKGYNVAVNRYISLASTVINHLGKRLQYNSFTGR